MKLYPPTFKGRLVKEKDGTTVCHRVWFKILLNPILRSLGYVIVSHLDAQETVIGYSLQKYPLLLPNLPSKAELQTNHALYRHELLLYKFNKRIGIKTPKPKKKAFLTQIHDPATTDRGWDIPPMFPYSNTTLPTEGEGTPSAIQSATPTLFL